MLVFLGVSELKNKGSFGNNVKERLFHLISKIDHFQGKTAKP